jgi:pimeloyl-ACP methyl ester carboxylesterase
MAQKPVITLLPGLLSDQDAWQFQQQALTDHADVRIADFRGMDSLGAMADKVLTQAPETFAIAGHSMGGRVGLELIHRAPQRITHLILLSVGAHAVTDDECEQRSSLVEEAASIGMDRYAVSWANLMLSHRSDDNPQVRHCIETMARRQSLDDFIAHITAGLGRGDQSRYLPSINIPVLLIVGAKDIWSPVSQHEAICRQIPDARLEIVLDAGHMVILDQPDVVNRLILDWLLRK